MIVLIATQNYSSLPLHPTGRPTGRFKTLLSDDVAFPGKFYGDPIPRTHYYNLFEMKLIYLPSSFVFFRSSSLVLFSLLSCCGMEVSWVLSAWIIGIWWFCGPLFSCQRFIFVGFISTIVSILFIFTGVQRVGRDFISTHRTRLQKRVDNLVL